MRTKTDEKKKSILKAAMKLFLKEGYDSVSMSAIAAKADCSKMTIYSYFSSKEELFQEATRDAMRPGFNHAFQMLKTDEDPRVCLENFGVAMVRSACKKDRIDFIRLLAAQKGKWKLGPEVYANGRGAEIELLADYFRDIGLQPHSGHDLRTAARNFFILAESDCIINLMTGAITSVSEEEILANVRLAVNTFFLVCSLPEPCI